MTKLSDQILAERLTEAEKQVTVGGRYRHYKGNDYGVLQLALLEATTEVCVVYRAEYGKKLLFIRPLSDWLLTVEYNGKQMPRFTKID